MAKKTDGYIHGCSPKEQQRLLDQADFLEPYFYSFFDFRRSRLILEAGCGVGAQTKILLRRFPNLSIEAIDASAAQLDAARNVLSNELLNGRVRLSQQNAERLKFPARSFDGAFLCWFLEHVADPVKILKEIRRTLKRGATIYCTEVHNASFHINPKCELMMEFWSAFNSLQEKMHGDPNVGSKLGSLLHEAGFKKIEHQIKQLVFDDRDPKARIAFLNYWETLLLSAAPSLLEKKVINENFLVRWSREWSHFKRLKHTIFLYTPFQAMAVAP